jgi:peptidyl-prolyl cis-trans isomerase A (cyclophilin A)
MIVEPKLLVVVIVWCSIPPPIFACECPYFSSLNGYKPKSSLYFSIKADQLPNDFNTGIIQGGIYRSHSDMIGKVKPIPHESTKQTGLSHVDGTVSFASMGAGTATTEFFICIGDQSPLDFGRSGSSDGQGFAAFGTVVKGMKVVRKIQSQNSYGEMFAQKVAILSIERL